MLKAFVTSPIFPALTWLAGCLWGWFVASQVCRVRHHQPSDDWEPFIGMDYDHRPPDL